MAIVDPKVLEELRAQAQKMLEECRQKGPRCVLLTAKNDSDVPGDPPEDAIVVNPPSRAQWRRFRVAGVDDRQARIDALELLLRDCVVAPTGPALEAVFERRPGLVETFGEEVLKIAGAQADVRKNA